MGELTREAAPQDFTWAATPRTVPARRAAAHAPLALEREADEVAGADAGLEQQGFAILGQAEGDVDWDLVERLDERAQAG